MHKLCNNFMVFYVSLLIMGCFTSNAQNNGNRMVSEIVVVILTSKTSCPGKDMAYHFIDRIQDKDP